MADELYPLVSVGVPVYNGAKYLIDTLESICKQSYPNFEIIVIDDASTDNSYELCKEWSANASLKIQLYQHDVNKGLPATCNSILKLAKGEFIQFVDQDDILLPDKLKADVELFQGLSKDTAFIYSPLKLINEKGELTGEDYFKRIGFNESIEGPVFTSLVKKNFIPAPTVMIRSRCIQAVGGYDESLLFQDWDMWLMLSKQFKVYYQTQNNVYYRIHSSSMMADKDAGQTIKRNDANIRMVKKHLGFSKDFDKVLFEKLKELSIYSYYIGDKKASDKLRNQLRLSFDAKVLCYYLMSLLGLKYSISWFKKKS